jgi:MFS family permease
MSIQTEQGKKSSDAEPQAKVASFRQVLQNRNFLLLWMAQLLSQTILNAANFGLVALVSDRPDGALMASLAVISFTLPAIPFSVLAGVIVDRVDKRMVLWVSNLVRLVIMLLMFFWLLYDRTNVWALFGLMFLTSLVGQFFIPAEGAAIPLLVGERELMPALSLFNVTGTLAQAIGFLVMGRAIVAIFVPFTIALGTVQFFVHPTDMVFVVAAALYAVCLLLILFIPTDSFTEGHLQKEPKTLANTTVRDALVSLWQDMLEGWSIIHKDRMLFFSVIQLSVVGIILQLIGALAGTFVKVILDRPAEDMSIILAPAAIGLVGASVLMPRITERVGKVRLANIGLVVLGVGFALIPLAHWLALALDPRSGSHSPLLFLGVVVLVFVLGVAMACVNIPTQTMMQQQAPEEGRARVLSLQFMLYSTGTVPVLLFAGGMTQVFGFGQIVLCFSALILLFCLWGVRYLKREAGGETESNVIDE